MKFRVCLKVDWLEEIRPKNKKFMLALLRFFVFDGCMRLASRVSRRVVSRVVARVSRRDVSRIVSRVSRRASRARVRVSRARAPSGPIAVAVGPTLYRF